MDYFRRVIFVFLLRFLHIASGKKGCCLKDKTQYTIGAHSGLPSGGVIGIYDMEARFAYDYSSKMWGVLTRTMYGSDMYRELIYIEDYNKRVRVFLTAKTCTIIPMLPFHTSMREYCIPDDAEVVEQTRLGAGSNSMNFNSLEYVNKLAGNFSARFKTGVDENCQFFQEQAWFFALNHTYTSHVTFFDEENLDDTWSVFDQYKKYYETRCTFQKEWPSLEEDGHRPYNVQEAFHFIKRLQAHDTDAEMDEERCIR